MNMMHRWFEEVWNYMSGHGLKSPDGHEVRRMKSFEASTVYRQME